MWRRVMCAGRKKAHFVRLLMTRSQRVSGQRSAARALANRSSFGCCCCYMYMYARRIMCMYMCLCRNRYGHGDWDLEIRIP